MAPALVTGFGLGAFLDGIVLHQVLQWHHVVEGLRPADDVAGLQHNTFWDGIFHLVAWVLVAAGLLWLWQRRDEGRDLGLPALTGLLLMGWGAFNVTDHLVFHLALGAHHIRMVENYRVYDWGFAALGVLLASVGWALARESLTRRQGPAPPRRRATPPPRRRPRPPRG